MRLPLTLAAALASFVIYVGSLQAQPAGVSEAHLDGFSGTSITQYSEEAGELCFTFRAARGNGAMSSQICVQGELAPSSNAQLSIVEEWQPHMGSRETRRSDNVDAHVHLLEDGSMHISYVASFEGATSAGSFVVPPRPKT